ncbi:MAG: class I tRNA ligase family protein [Acidobacteria bacterium]|nr:class I tRNA ligase family protein [Acidobacteriota bacterium]
MSGGPQPSFDQQGFSQLGIPVPGDPDHDLRLVRCAFELPSRPSVSGTISSAARSISGNTGRPIFGWSGKDILRFHTVLLAAFLMAAGLPVSKTVFAHGMWLSGGRKMSKTLGNVINLATLRKHFSTDSVRYFCTFARDGLPAITGNFTCEAMLDRVNTDLASGLGNLASCTLEPWSGIT